MGIQPQRTFANENIMLLCLARAFWVNLPDYRQLVLELKKRIVGDVFGLLFVCLFFVLLHLYGNISITRNY